MLETRRQWWTRKFLLGTNLAAPAALLATRFEQPLVMVAAALAHAAFASAVMRPQCIWFGPVVTRFAPRGRELWLTIDDGPAGAESEKLAAELQRRGVRATFFVIGRKLAAQPDTAQRVIAAGHTLANHTDTHPAACFAWLRPARLSGEVTVCNAVLNAADCATPRWFRAPVGLKNTRLHPLLRRLQMRLIAWTIRSGDGFNADPATVAAHVVKRARPGAIILFHEARPRSNETILKTVDALLARGFVFVIPDDAQLI